MVKMLSSALIIFGIGSFYTYVQFSHPGIIGIDGYFHIRFAQEMWHTGIIYDFRWLVYTIYSRNFTDDHFLFHVLQIPFTFGNLIVGAKIYAIIFPTLAFALFFALLTQQKIRFPLFWTALLFVSSAPFILRLGMPRAASISLIFLLIGTWIILNHQYKKLLPLAFCYVWLYGGFPLLFVMACVAFFTFWFAEHKKNPQIIFFCGLGMLLGLILNPYFPHNLSFLLKSYTQIELGMFPSHIPGGNEDYPYASSSAVRNALPVWCAVFAGMLAYMISKHRLDAKTLFLFLFSIALLCLYLNVRRFIEYWAPFGILFSAFALNPFIPEQPLKMLFKPSLGKGIAFALCLFLLLACWDTCTQIFDYRQNYRDPKTYQGAAEFLKRETPQNAIVFTADWDDFPLLFHFNSHNRYIVGMDLRYLYYYDPQLCDLWLSISDGTEKDAVLKIKEFFRADYIFCPKDEKAFLRNIHRSSGDKQIIYEDAHAILFKI